jgi:hypothetical protein
LLVIVHHGGAVGLALRHRMLIRLDAETTLVVALG